MQRVPLYPTASESSDGSHYSTDQPQKSGSKIMNFMKGRKRSVAELKPAANKGYYTASNDGYNNPPRQRLLSDPEAYNPYDGVTQPQAQWPNVQRTVSDTDTRLVSNSRPNTANSLSSGLPDGALPGISPLYHHPGRVPSPALSPQSAPASANDMYRRPSPNPNGVANSTPTSPQYGQQRDLPPPNGLNGFGAVSQYPNAGSQAYSSQKELPQINGVANGGQYHYPYDGSVQRQPSAQAQTSPDPKEKKSGCSMFSKFGKVAKSVGSKVDMSTVASIVSDPSSAISNSKYGQDPTAALKDANAYLQDPTNRAKLENSKMYEKYHLDKAMKVYDAGNTVYEAGNTAMEIMDDPSGYLQDKANEAMEDPMETLKKAKEAAETAAEYKEKYDKYKEHRQHQHQQQQQSSPRQAQQGYPSQNRQPTSPPQSSPQQSYPSPQQQQPHSTNRTSPTNQQAQQTYAGDRQQPSYTQLYPSHQRQLSSGNNTMVDRSLPPQSYSNQSYPDRGVSNSPSPAQQQAQRQDQRRISPPQQPPSPQNQRPQQQQYQQQVSPQNQRSMSSPQQQQYQQQMQPQDPRGISPPQQQLQDQRRGLSPQQHQQPHHQHGSGNVPLGLLYHQHHPEQPAPNSALGKLEQKIEKVEHKVEHKLHRAEHKIEAKIDDAKEDIEDLAHLKESWAIVNKGPPPKSKGLQVFEVMTAGAADVAVSVNTVDVLLAGASAAQIEKTIETFVEHSEVFMKALGEVAKIHPFVGVAVMAFQACWALEMKRRENDKRIMALYAEMKDMMGVLVQLKNVKDAEQAAPDGTSIKGRMQELCQKTADDIKSCANACDTYTKKKLVVKVLKGPVWEGKLVKFAATFTKRREEFEFALSIHTAVGIDSANKTLGSVDDSVKAMNDKMEMMTKMFEKLTMGMSDYREMGKLVERKGGAKACLDNDSALKELVSLEGGKSASASLAIGTKGGDKQQIDIDDLREDLATDPEVLMEKNMTVFNRKFEVQTRQIIDEVSKVVQREGDRIISALTGGPHEKIIDPDVYHIWKEMSWRGSVKIRHFVMTLRDYYHEKWDNSQNNNQSSRPGSPKMDKADEWALAYVNILRMQPISEAFDDDASGYVTIQESNDFTSSRPIDWSLPQWIAYWSIGWHQSLAMYAAKIGELMAKMFAILPRIKPINQSFANDYLNAVYTPIITIRDAISECIINDALQEKFASYIIAEEERLRGNLVAVDYDIDAEDTLRLVIGEGRIDKYALPMIYLLLKRHFDIFRVAQKKIIHPDELWDAADTMNWVFKAMKDRLEVLQSIFRQQRLDLKQHFKSFAHGMFEYMNDPSARWDPKIVQASEPPDYTYDDSLEDQDLDPDKVCNYPVDEELKDFAAYHARRSLPSTSPFKSSLRKLLGPWNGFHYKSSSSTYPVSGMMCLDIVPEEGSERRFKSVSRSNGMNFTITGECSTSTTASNTINFTLKITFPPPHPAQFLKGTWTAINDTLIGTWWTSEDTKSKGTFTYKRMAPENLCFYPSPGDLKANKAGALWGFALHAVRDRIRRRNLPWIYFRERGQQRKRFVELYIRSTRYGKPLNDAEREELRKIQKSLTNADHLFYVSIAKQQIRKTAVHAEPCESCDGAIGGGRLSCLTCKLQEKFDTIDFCEDPDCLSQRIVRPHLLQPHVPTHDLVKFRRVVHIREFGKSYRDAKDALERARGYFNGAVVYRPAPVDDDDDDDRSEGNSGSVTPATPLLTCAGCGQEVAQPCWYCVQCTHHPTFICFNCEAKKVPIPKHDINVHDLVRVQEFVEEVKVSMEERLTGMDERLGKFETDVSDRLSRMEKLLERLLGKVDDGSILSLDNILLNVQ